MTDSAALRALFPNSRVPAAPIDCSPRLVTSMVENGLGPLAYRALSRGAIDADQSGVKELKAADLTARVITDQSATAIEAVLIHLNEHQIKPTLLKGISIISRYPQRHWRLMSDIDLLVAEDEVASTEAALRAMGFVNGYAQPDSHWDGHHHSAPLTHPELKIWIEVHRRVASGKILNCPPLSVEQLWPQRQPSEQFPELAYQLPPRVELNYLAAHWYLNLIEDLGIPGLQRALFDATFLLDGQTIDADWLLPDPQLAFATTTLLLTLHELDAIALSPASKQQLTATQQLDPKNIEFALGLIRKEIIPLTTPERSTLQSIRGSWFELALTGRHNRSFLWRRLTRAGSVILQSLKQRWRKRA